MPRPAWPYTRIWLQALTTIAAMFFHLLCNQDDVRWGNLGSTPQAWHPSLSPSVTCWDQAGGLPCQSPHIYSVRNKGKTSLDCICSGLTGKSVISIDIQEGRPQSAIFIPAWGSNRGLRDFPVIQITGVRRVRTSPASTCLSEWR